MTSGCAEDNTKSRLPRIARTAANGKLERGSARLSRRAVRANPQKASARHVHELALIVRHVLERLRVTSERCGMRAAQVRARPYAQWLAMTETRTCASSGEGR
jgi:hypothetical protein